MASGAAFVMCGYEAIRTTAHTLFITSYGKEATLLATGLVPVGVTLVLYIYGALLSALGPRRTLRISTLLAVVTMLCGYAAVRAGFRPARYLLFIFKESYVVFLVEQYWSFINSMLSREAAKKYYGPICGIASIGAIAGGLLLLALSKTFGTLNMVLLAALVTLPGAFIADLAYRRFGEPPGRTERHGLASTLGLSLFRREPVLLLIISLVGSAQLVSGVLENSFKWLLQDAIPNADAQNAYSGSFYAILNGAAMVFQFLVAPLVLRYLSLGLIHRLIPIVHIAGCALLFFRPTLLVAGGAYLLFKSLDYSVFRAAKEILYVPLSFDARYRAKELIDVLGYRASKGAAFLGITAFRQAGVLFSTPIFAAIGAVSAAVWLGLSWPLSRYDERSLPKSQDGSRPHP